MKPILQWFNRPAARSRVAEQKSYRHGMVAWQDQGPACWSSGSPAQLAKRAYSQNPIVYRCVQMICEAAASLPWVLYEQEEELVVHPALKLLGKPNPRQSGDHLLENVYGHLLLYGNAFLQLIVVNGEIREIHALAPQFVKLTMNGDGSPASYDFKVGSYKKRFAIDPPDPKFAHLSLGNPTNDLWGQSPLGAAHMAMDIHNAASHWNKALLDNSARPSGALVYSTADGANLTEEQFGRLKSELEEGYSGSARAGRPLVLEGGLDWKAMGHSPKDMDFIEAKHGASRDIALAFGVPPMLLGIPGDNTYSNYREANRAFWQQTVLPLATRLCGSLTHWLLKNYDSDLRLDVDRDEIIALAGDREALWSKVGSADFLTIDEKRQAVGYGPIGSGDVSHAG